MLRIGAAAPRRRPSAAGMRRRAGALLALLCVAVAQFNKNQFNKNARAVFAAPPASTGMCRDGLSYGARAAAFRARSAGDGPLGKACCDARCRVCGGRGCKGHGLAGEELCCAAHITAQKRQCANASDVGCVIPLGARPASRKKADAEAGGAAQRVCPGRIASPPATPSHCRCDADDAGAKSFCGRGSPFACLWTALLLSIRGPCRSSRTGASRPSTTSSTRSSASRGGAAIGRCRGSKWSTTRRSASSSRGASASRRQRRANRRASAQTTAQQRKTFAAAKFS